MKYLFCLLFCLLMLANANAFTAKPAMQSSQEVNESYSFENDFDGWTPRTIFENTELPTTIERSQTLSRDGVTALKLDVFSFESVWIEKLFFLEPNQVYELEYNYAFASRDFTTSNAFIILTGATRKPIGGDSDITPLFQEIAFNNDETSVGYKWLDKTYTAAAKTDETGKLYISIGVHGTDFVRRIYYLDNLRITIRKKASLTEHFSFENDLEGWTPKAIDLNANTSITDIIKLWRFGAFDGASALRFDLSQENSKGTVWVEKPFSIERGKKYKVTIDMEIVPFSHGFPQKSKLITGVSKRPIESLEDLAWSSEEIPEKENFARYLNKVSNFVVKAKKTDFLYVVIGIRGKEDVRQIYHFDNLCITITEK